MKKKKRAIIGGMFLFGLFSFMGVLLEDLLLILLGIPFFLLFILALIRIGRFTKKEIKNYIPKKGFKYLRKTQSERIKNYTRIQCVFGIICAIIVIILIFLNFGWAIKMAVFGIVYLQSIKILKSRLKLHVPIDDATYFELEELGIIGNKDVVKTIYCDLKIWDKLEEGRKILIVTQDNLVCVHFESREKATKIICPLSKIEKLEMMGTGHSGEGYLLVIGYGNNFLNIKLFGDSSYDSTEEFMACFLKELDRCLLGKVSNEIRNSNSNSNSKSTDILFNSNNVPRINIRQIDIDVTSNNFMQSNNKVDEFKGNQQNRRYIEL